MRVYPSTASSDILDSWKEIAVYLNRDVRTVMRWEQTRGLPVHRLPGGSAVHALKEELDAWRRSGGIHLVPTEEDENPAAAPGPGGRSVAVLPFANLTAEKESEYFSDGLADEIINALTRVKGLRVTARTSSFAFRGKEQDVREIGSRLGTEYLLEGSVQRAGTRLRVSAQLVSSSDGFHVWSDRYDRELTDIFAVQEEIARSIVAAMQLKIEPPEVPKKKPVNIDAYNAWLKGRHYRFRAQTLEDMLEAGKWFARAAALDADFAAAHLEMGQHMIYSAVLGLVSPHQIAAQGRPQVARALELDDQLGEAHASMGEFRALLDFDWAGAESEFTKALSCEPGSAVILRRHAAWVLMPQNRLEQAEAEATRSLELDPLSPESHFIKALALFFRRQYSRAEASIRTTLELGGANPSVRWVGGVIAALQGRFEEALTGCEDAVRLYGMPPFLRGGLGMIYGFVGKTAEARDMLAQMERDATKTYVSPIYRAWVYLGLGEMDRAFEWLDHAIDAHDPHVLHLPVKPVYDRLRGDSRFDALLRKMRLGEAGSRSAVTK